MFSLELTNIVVLFGVAPNKRHTGIDSLRFLNEQVQIFHFGQFLEGGVTVHVISQD